MEIDLGGGKLPPQAPEIEEAVLGAALLEKEGCMYLLQFIQNAEVFYKARHQAIFTAIQNITNAGDDVDILTITQELVRLGQLEQVGGAYTIVALTQKVNSSAHIETHCKMLLELYSRRNSIALMTRLIDAQYDLTTDSLTNLTEIQLALNTLNENMTIKQTRTAAELYMATMKQLIAATEAKGGITGVPIGIQAVDRLTGGFQKSDLIILAARPSMGKTSFVVTGAKNAAAMFNIPVAIFSLEMSAEQLMVRIISSESGRTNSELTKGILGKDVIVNDVATRAKKISTYPLFIDDTPAISIGQLRAKAAKLKSKYDIQMVVIDYLQLMTGDKGQKGNREQEIASISRNLKLLAKELNIPVTALAQLSRAVESRTGDKKPMLSDLRESGSIEQDADVVAFLYRPEYYGITEDDMGVSTRGTGNLIFAKHRNGSLGEVIMKCELSTNYWGDLSSLYDHDAMTGYVAKVDENYKPSLPPSDFEQDLPF